jgi:hypothetical protein
MLTQKLTTNGQNDAPDRSPVTVYHRPRTRPTSTERTSTDQSLDSTDVSYLIRNPDSSKTQPTPQLSTTINPIYSSVYLSVLGLPALPYLYPAPAGRQHGRPSGRLAHPKSPCPSAETRLFIEIATQQRMRISGTHMEIRSTGRAALDAVLFLAASNPVLYWSQV